MTPADLRRAIKLSGLSKHEFARRAGVSYRNLAKKLQGVQAVGRKVEGFCYVTLSVIARDGLDMALKASMKAFVQGARPAGASGVTHTSGEDLGDTQPPAAKPS